MISHNPNILTSFVESHCSTYIYIHMYITYIYINDVGISHCIPKGSLGCYRKIPDFRFFDNVLELKLAQREKPCMELCSVARKEISRHQAGGWSSGWTFQS
jgi:hypothetical protein